MTILLTIGILISGTIIPYILGCLIFGETPFKTDLIESFPLWFIGITLPSIIILLFMLCYKLAVYIIQIN